jgi:hypothetical protein
MIKRIGQDFTKSIHLNLLPGIKLDKGYWQAEIRFITDVNGTRTLCNDMYNHYGEPRDFYVIVGQDVHEISFTCYRHNSYPGNPNTYIHYSLRVDRILLLNFIYALTNSTIQLEKTSP